jgi:hypothetical protein
MSGSHHRAMPTSKQQLQQLEHARKSVTPSPDTLVMSFAHVTERLLLIHFPAHVDHAAAAAQQPVASVVRMMGHAYRLNNRQYASCANSISTQQVCAGQPAEAAAAQQQQ